MSKTDECQGKQGMGGWKKLKGEMEKRVKLGRDQLKVAKKSHVIDKRSVWYNRY